MASLTGPTTESRVWLTPSDDSRYPPLNLSALPRVASWPATAAFESMLASVTRARSELSGGHEGGSNLILCVFGFQFLERSPSAIFFMVPITLFWRSSENWSMTPAISPISSFRFSFSPVAKVALARVP